MQGIAGPKLLGRSGGGTVPRWAVCGSGSGTPRLAHERTCKLWLRDHDARIAAFGPSEPAVFAALHGGPVSRFDAGLCAAGRICL